MLLIDTRQLLNLYQQL